MNLGLAFLGTITSICLAWGLAGGLALTIWGIILSWRGNRARQGV